MEKSAVKSTKSKKTIKPELPSPKRSLALRLAQPRATLEQVSAQVRLTHGDWRK